MNIYLDILKICGLVHRWSRWVSTVHSPLFSNRLPISSHLLKNGVGVERKELSLSFKQKYSPPYATVWMHVGMTIILIGHSHSYSASECVLTNELCNCVVIVRSIFKIWIFQKYLFRKWMGERRGPDHFTSAFVDIGNAFLLFFLPCHV